MLALPLPPLPETVTAGLAALAPAVSRSAAPRIEVPDLPLSALRDLGLLDGREPNRRDPFMD